MLDVIRVNDTFLSWCAKKRGGGEMTGKKRISVVIPVFDPQEAHFEFLYRAFESIAEQTVMPLEVVLTANHEIKYLARLLGEFSNKFEIVYSKNKSRNASENLNYAVKIAGGDVIKILFQDDFLLHTQVLEKCSEIDSKNPWIIFSYIQANESGESIGLPMFPLFTKRLILGENLIGAPSLVAFAKDSFIKVDENLVFLFDCDWYLRMAHKWGYPKIDTQVSVAIRLHPGQATHWAVRHKKREIRITKGNHKSASKTECRCVQDQTP